MILKYKIQNTPNSNQWRLSRPYYFSTADPLTTISWKSRLFNRTDQSFRLTRPTPSIVCSHQTNAPPIAAARLTPARHPVSFGSLSVSPRLAPITPRMSAFLAEKTLGAPEEAPMKEGSPAWGLHHPVEGIDSRDVETPDVWVPRNPKLIRLTGRHPFNCEPPMEDLMGAGMVTPTSLHLVRNHGAVPKLDWSAHRIDVGGLVDSPVSLTMSELVKMPSITVLATVTCAGNRRKEENMIKKSIGFNWGPCATSCTYWTGVRLCDVLKLAQAKSPKQDGNHVCFRGPKGELPKGEDGSYGTSVPMYHAMDPANDVILAYKQNGRWLTPDHGFPVRMIIPGYIGGRMVKWLSEITVTKEPSNNFYHFHDNRVLPPHVDEKLAKEEGWWYKPEFIINELNINSAVARPAHDEFLSLEKNKPYKMSGYAYTGGGRQVIRVESSLDDGASWQQATIHRFEKPTVYGKTWCWVFWDLEVQTMDLFSTNEILVRAWDSGQNGQPAYITWNVMGMMNNCHYRVKIHKQSLENGAIGLRFQHPAPVESGQFDTPGWRCEEQQVLRGLEEAELHIPKLPSPVLDESFQAMSLADSATELMNWPPSPSDSFDSLSKLNSGTKQATKAVEAEMEFLTALNPKKKIPFTLVEKTILSRDARKLRFALQSPKHVLGLPVGKHMFFYAEIDGKMCMRAYTPSSSNNLVGYFELVIKVYFANEHPKFPRGGKMSQHFDRMKIGDTIDVKGPLGHFVYTGPGKCLKNKTAFDVKRICMIAGGTGITPCYQVAQNILENPDDKTEVALLFANKDENDILLREELDAWASKHKNFKVWYTLDNPPEGWQYSTGFINQEMLQLALFPHDADSIVCMCGPPPMLEFACKPNLEKIGWTPDQFIVF